MCVYQEADKGFEELRGPCGEVDRPAAEGPEGSGVHLQVHRTISGPFQPVSLLSYVLGFQSQIRLIKLNALFPF